MTAIPVVYKCNNHVFALTSIHSPSQVVGNHGDCRSERRHVEPEKSDSSTMEMLAGRCDTMWRSSHQQGMLAVLRCSWQTAQIERTALYPTRHPATLRAGRFGCLMQAWLDRGVRVVGTKRLGMMSSASDKSPNCQALDTATSSIVNAGPHCL